MRFSYAPVPSPVTGPFAADTGAWTKAAPHRGVDFGASFIPCVAPAPGLSVPHTNNPVNFNGRWVPAFGESICLDHGENFGEFRYSLFAHLSQKLISIGDYVDVGATIGITGNTGYAFGAHLHWQLSRNTYFTTDIRDSADPMLYIQEVEDLTRDEVRDMIKAMQNSGELASTTDVLACIAQIVGAEDLTYTDTERVQRVRDILNIEVTPDD